MDIPRYALIAASVLLGLMLLGEWTRFSEAQQAAALPATPMVTPSSLDSDLSDESALATSPSQSDLPVNEDINLSASGNANTISSDDVSSTTRLAARFSPSARASLA